MGPRIYNLFPLLAGPVPRWAEHVPRIARMRFDWIYVNPFHYAGFSGSLYAIKDPARLHATIDDGTPMDEAVDGFVAAAGEAGLSVMIDLVINHTAKDALLAEARPDWYRRDADGSLYSPRAVDPDDPDNVTIWGDLAELDYQDAAVSAALVDHWRGYLDWALDRGIRGFRCDAAYQVPAEVWRPLIDHVRRRRPDCLFAAETLGCTPEEVAGLAGAGFDYLFNSAKWWNFRDAWLLEQYAGFRGIAPSIAFPESHDTERLATDIGEDEPGQIERHYCLRYLFAALFSAGVMMPMGYEYGFRRKPHVVDSRSEHWAEEATGPAFDLTGFVAEVNALKSTVPTLNIEGAQAAITDAEAPVVALLRVAGDDVAGDGPAVLTLLNPDTEAPAAIGLAELDAAGAPARFVERTPGMPESRLDDHPTLTVPPLTLRLFVTA